MVNVGVVKTVSELKSKIAVVVKRYFLRAVAIVFIITGAAAVEGIVYFCKITQHD